MTDILIRSEESLENTFVVQVWITEEHTDASDPTVKYENQSSAVVIFDNDQYTMDDIKQALIAQNNFE
jgi:TATA-binding protein-associated factor Taf7